ncbi:MAG TPA: class I SAM-dependent methyltransferase [Bryobacteraceae bacterium]|nr:class I SAM-dependent methyltransferase [Bryobacteraceae bacterium]
MEDRYFAELAQAFVRGRLANSNASIHDGIEAGLRLHKFKSNAELPRVKRVLGILRGLQPQSLLDVGSGRGTFLWPLLDAFPHVRVTAVDLSERRAADLGAVATGGINRLQVACMDVQRPALSARSFDIVTALEVLEHLHDPHIALTHIVAMARRFVLLSVPSVPDDNPGHLHLFGVDQLLEMAERAGGVRTTIEHVLNHRIVLIRLG